MGGSTNKADRRGPGKGREGWGRMSGSTTNKRLGKTEGLKVGYR